MRSGIFGDRVGWMRRRLKNGRHAWGPGGVDESLLIGATRMDSVGLTSFEQTRMFFDKATGAFRAGSTAAPASVTAWDTLGSGSVAFSGGVATGANSLALGSRASATGNGSVCLNGVGNAGALCSGTSWLLGDGSTVSGNLSGAIGVWLGSVTSDHSFQTGHSNTNSALFTHTSGSAVVASRQGQRAHGSAAFSTNGDAQWSAFVMRKLTSDATATELAVDGSTAYLTIGATRTMSFHIKLAAHRTDVSGTAAAWPLITGGITRDSSGNCRLLGTVTGAGTTTLCDAGASTWTVAVTADSTNNRLAITVTGEAAKTIRWVASVEMAEVG